MTVNAMKKPRAAKRMRGRVGVGREVATIASGAMNTANRGRCVIARAAADQSMSKGAVLYVKRHMVSIRCSGRPAEVHS